MSLVRLALRLIVRRALSGATMADDRVRDSDITDLESALSSVPQPIALIYTDDQTRTPVGKDLFCSSGSISLVLILAMAGAATVTIDGREELQFAFPRTDAGLELQLDFMERQAFTALTDPDTVWSALFRDLVQKIGTIKSTRGGSTKAGTRFAARQISMDVETLGDPTPGQQLGPFWRRLVAALNNDPDEQYQELGPLIQAMVEGKPLPAYKVAVRDQGLSNAAVDAIGIAPALGHDPETQDGEPAILTELTVVRADQNGQEAEEGISSDDEAVVP